MKTTLNAEQMAYLNKLINQAPADWPHALQVTMREVCKTIQETPYELMRGVIAAWILDGHNRFMTLNAIKALQTDVDMRDLIA